MVTKDFLLRKLQPFENNKNYLVQDQTTNDIVKGIEATHKKYCSEYDKIYKYFVGSSITETAENVFNFLKKNIPYKPESGSKQCLHSPTAILCLNKYFDCKSYSLFTNGIMDAYRRNNNKNFDLYFRYAGYASNNIEHVFALVKLNGGKKYIWIDPVLPTFDERKQPKIIEDKKINMALVEINGIPNRNIQMNRNNILPPYVSAGKTYESVGAISFIGKKNIGYCNNSTINGGFFGALLGIDKKILKEYQEALPQLGISFLYRFLTFEKNVKYMGAFLENEIYILPNDFVVPSIVKEKIDNADRFFLRTNGQIDEAITAREHFKMLEQGIINQIGITPKEFWTRFFNQQSINGLQNTVNTATNLVNTGANLLNTGISLVSPLIAPISTIINLVSTLMPTLRYDPPIETFAFQISDWSGTNYPKDKSLLRGGDLSKTNNSGGSLLPLGLGLLAAKFLFFK
jgi:hypothetical protein